jgi:hypothetical protein
MKKYLTLLWVLAIALLACTQDGALPTAGPETDRAIIATVLKDFANWKEATFGELEGVLELEQTSMANPDATQEGIRSLAREASAQLSDDVIANFIERNKSAVSVTALFSDMPWARVRQPPSKDTYEWELPKGAKARGSLTLPGLSADRKHALIQIHHSWSIHGAFVTYALSFKNGSWQVSARGQAVFL